MMEKSLPSFIPKKENETDEEALERFRNAPTDPAPPPENNEEDDRLTVLEMPKVEKKI